MIKAVIDLGTNTFHLLIAETDGTSYFKSLWQERSYVFLASDGLNEISQSAENRAITTILRFQEKMAAHAPSEVIVSGTEAFRKAKNGQGISRRISKILNAEVHILSGEMEAKMIGKAVELALHPLQQNGIAVDIGGGSTELVSIRKSRSDSFISQPCGIAYLYNRFHQEDPISAKSLENMKNYIASCYHDFVANHNSLVGSGGCMIGVAGTFEVLRAMSPSTSQVSLTTQLMQIDQSFIRPLIERVSTLDLKGRECIPGLPTERAMYFLEGLVIMDQIWQLHTFDTFCISNYSIKHGLMVSNF